MEIIKFERTEIDRENIRRALQCLEDNGIDKDECPVVLQALGYILTDTELEDLLTDEDSDIIKEWHEDYNKSNDELAEHIFEEIFADIEQIIERCDNEFKHGDHEDMENIDVLGL